MNMVSYHQLSEVSMEGKDSINIGIFSAIYFVIVLIVAIFGTIPIFLPMLTWICPVTFIAAFICGIIGGLLGKTLMKKHFEKAGIS